MNKRLKWRQKSLILDEDIFDNKEYNRSRSFSVSHKFYYDSNLFEKNTFFSVGDKNNLRRSFADEICIDRVLHRDKKPEKISIYDLELDKKDAFPQSKFTGFITNTNNRSLSPNIKITPHNHCNKLSSWSTTNMTSSASVKYSMS